MNRKKIICPCYGVTKGQVEDAVNSGAHRFKEVKSLTKAGKACGTCKPKIKKLIVKIRKKHK